MKGLHNSWSGPIKMQPEAAQVEKEWQTRDIASLLCPDQLQISNDKDDDGYGTVIPSKKDTYLATVKRHCICSLSRSSKKGAIQLLHILKTRMMMMRELLWCLCWIKTLNVGQGRSTKKDAIQQHILNTRIWSEPEWRKTHQEGHNPTMYIFWRQGSDRKQ